ncbi:MAG TPA: phosphodiesterase [Terriglobales bacterium]|nr:phosphodiesterase [Terriglobales bacterium]
MTKLIVFTDLHMLPEGGRIIGLDPFERLLNGVRHVNRYHSDATRVICTGDLTHKGDPVSYGRLREVLSELTIPYSLLLGNHDARAAFRAEFPEVPVDPAGYVQDVIETAEGRLILLDTLIEPPHDFPYSSGHLCADRMTWLDQRLAEASERPCYIFMHHPPHDVGFPGMDEIKLMNGPAFYDLLRRHGNVRHIFAGHVHRTISGSSHGIPFSIFKSPVHQQPMDFERVDCSLSVPEPAAYGIILLQDDGALVHTEDYEIAGLGAGNDEASMVPAPAA